MEQGKKIIYDGNSLLLASLVNKKEERKKQERQEKEREMGRTQALTCIALLLILVVNHEVQADTICNRQCPSLCHKKGKSLFLCYLYCIKHCDSGHKRVELTKEEEEQLKSDNESMLKIEEQLIHTPHHELERHYADKVKAYIQKPPKDFKVRNGKNKENGSTKKVQ